jgi:hypothetical protein
MFTSLCHLFTCLTKTENVTFYYNLKLDFYTKKVLMLQQNDTQNNDMLSVIMQNVAMLSDVLVSQR